jgi:integron integrase
MWIRRFVRYHGTRHPRELGATEVAAFLSMLAQGRQVSASTQNLALSALLFLYREVLGEPLVWVEGIVRARVPQRIPVVLTRDEVRAVLAWLRPRERLVSTLLYGAGLRLLESLTLRVKDIDFGGNQIVVRGGKGGKDRVVPFPGSARQEMTQHLEATRALHLRDIAAGAGEVILPDALGQKYPTAGRDWRWQYVFPATRQYVERGSGKLRRHHLHESVVQQAVRGAAERAGLPKRVSCHTFRHSFATHLLEDGYDIRTIQELLGHKDVSTTMIYTHVLNRGGRGVRSPADAL